MELAGDQQIAEKTRQKASEHSMAQIMHRKCL